MALYDTELAISAQWVSRTFAGQVKLEDDMFGLNRNRMTGIGRSIKRVMEIEGVVLPEFIHNGGYFFINLPVYADGLVDAWDLLDRQLFEEKLAQGWVTTSVPDGESIYAHGLSSWVVRGGKWKLSPH